MKISKSLIILFIALSSLIGCNHNGNNDSKQISDTTSFITKTKWNINLEGTDSLEIYNHLPMIFRNNYLHFSRYNVGSYEIRKDTLCVKNVYYTQMKDSLIRKESLKMIARIIKVNQDSLILEKVKGKGFYFTHGGVSRYLPSLTTLKFYNDTLNFLNPTDFDKICLSSSLCYGTCPAQAVEISSSGNYKFFGGKYSKLNGYYIGNISNGYIDSLKLRLTSSIINPDNLSNVPPIDASFCDIKIISQNDTINIYGCPADFSFRLKEFYNMLMNSYERADLMKSKQPIKFITKSHINE